MNGMPPPRPPTLTHPSLIHTYVHILLNEGRGLRTPTPSEPLRIRHTSGGPPPSRLHLIILNILIIFSSGIRYAVALLHLDRR